MTDWEEEDARRPRDRWERQGTADWANGVEIAARYAYRPGAFWLGRLAGDEAARIGYRGDGHIFMCARPGAGKGRTFIINNLATWEGSVVALDPAGENANVTAVRRGPGDRYCDGMGQEVYVLDPFNEAKHVPDELKAYYDPMADLALWPNREDLILAASMLSEAIVVPPENAGEAAQWVEKGREYIRDVILHVLTHKFFEGRRSLRTVRTLVVSGMRQEARELDEMNRLDAANVEGAPSPELVDAFRLLGTSMAGNDEFDGMIAEQGEKILSEVDNPEYFKSVLSNAAKEVYVLGAPQVRKVTEPGEYQRTFSAADIKGDPRGISVYVVLPSRREKEFGRWQRLLIFALTEACYAQGPPENGEPILLCLDEFLSLGKTERLLDIATQGRKYFVQMFIAVQNFARLEEVYGKSHKTFLDTAGCQIYFGIDALDVRKYIREFADEREVITYEKTLSASTATAWSRTTTNTLGFSETTNKGRSVGTTSSETRSRSESEGEAISYSKSWNEARGVSKGRQASTQWGWSSGRQWGVTYDPWSLFQLSDQGNRGRQVGRNKGGSFGWNTSQSLTSSAGGSESTSTNRSVSNSYGTTTGQSETFTVSDAEGRTSSVATAYGQTETVTRGENLAGRVSKRALVTYAMMNKLFGVTDEHKFEHESLVYPGFALILVTGEDPFIVRKCNYDQDVEFRRCFSKHPDFDFVPFEETPMLGWQYTPAHFLEIRNPPDLKAAGFKMRVWPKLEVGRDFRKDPGDRKILGLQPRDARQAEILYLPGPAKVVEISGPVDDQTLVLRTDKVVRPDIVERELFGKYLGSARAMMRADAAKAERKKRYEDDAKAARAAESAERNRRLDAAKAREHAARTAWLGVTQRASLTDDWFVEKQAALAFAGVFLAGLVLNLVTQTWGWPFASIPAGFAAGWFAVVTRHKDQEEALERRVAVDEAEAEIQALQPTWDWSGAGKLFLQPPR